MPRPSDLIQVAKGEVVTQSCEWRDVKGFEGRYLVSSYGRVLSLARNSVLRPLRKSTRYDCVRLYHGGGRGDYEDQLVHRVVANAFLEKPEGICEVNHIDGDRHNNAVTNLEWVSHRENMLHAVSHGLVDTKMACSAHRKPIVCSNGRRYESVRSASKALGILESCISACAHGRVKTANGYTFSFVEQGI